MDEAESDPDSDAAVEALIEEFGGDPRSAILALLHDIDLLARDFDASVSRGFVRHEKTIWLKTISARKVGAGE